MKVLLINSRRFKTTTLLTNWAINQRAKPHLYSASAVGIYGLQSKLDPEPYDETTFVDYQPPRDFLNEIGLSWEKALKPAQKAGMPVTVTRSGVVLKRGQGMLKKLTPALKNS